MANTGYGLHQEVWLWALTRPHPHFRAFSEPQHQAVLWTFFSKGQDMFFCFVFSAKGLILPFYVNRGQQRVPRYSLTAAAAAKLLQSCPTLCDPIDGSPPGFSVPGILQARIFQWVAISFSNTCMHAKSFQSCLTLCDPMDSSPPGSSVHRIFQTRILEWVAISFSNSLTSSSQIGWGPVS